MYYLKGLSFDKTGVKGMITFGSKGWSGKAVNKLAEALEDSGFQVSETYEVDYVPTEEQLDECFAIGQRLGKEIKESF